MNDVGEQWAGAVTTIHGLAVSDTQRGVVEGQSIYTFHSDLFVTKLGALSSMNADGFSIDFTESNNFATRTGSLALAGVRTAIGCLSKVPTPDRQTVSLGFSPSAVLLFSVQTSSSSVPTSGSRWAMGALCSEGQAASALVDIDAQSPTQVFSTSTTDAAFVLVDSGVQSTAIANGTLTTDGFALDWLVNDGEQTQICYWAIGDPL